MMTSSSSATTILTLSDREIVASRIFDAPRELVWLATTEPRHVAHWWGPREMTLTVCEADVRPGGTWRYVQRGPDGQEYPFRGVYLEVVPPEKVVMTQIFDVEPYSRSELVVTVTLSELEGGRTKLSSALVFDSPEACQGAMAMGMERGMRESWDRLAELLPTIA
jgi:uncharacterized protein YndB with AHSA1/START domain